MYDEILEGVKVKNSFKSESELIIHLKGLQKQVKYLRQKFKKFPVKIDYTDVKIQEAYMFAYYPHYTELLYYALNDASNMLNNKYPSRLLLFGSGPCPEIVGYLKFLNKQNLAENLNLNVSIFDISSTYWEHSRDITFNQIISNYQNGHTISNYNSEYFSFNEPLSNNEPLSKSALSKPCLVVYQNCLNEIDSTGYDIIKSNFEKLYNNLPSNSIIAIIDLSNYPDVVDLISSIQANLSSKNGFKLLRDIKLGAMHKLSNYKNPTSFIEKNLLTGKNGLIPRRKVKFTYSLIRKE